MLLQTTVFISKMGGGDRAEEVGGRVAGGEHGEKHPKKHEMRAYLYRCL